MHVKVRKIRGFLHELHGESVKHGLGRLLRIPTGDQR